MGICHESEQVIGENPKPNVRKDQQRKKAEELNAASHLPHADEAALDKEIDITKTISSSSRQEQVLQLYEEFRPRLLRYIDSMHLSREYSEEIVQEAFVRLMAELVQGNEIENVQGWIVRVTRNLTMDAIKRRNRDATHMAEITTVEVNSWVDPSARPEEVYMEKEQATQMETALLTLNPSLRQCFNMRVQGFRFKDIAVALGISEQRAAAMVKQVSVRLAVICGVSSL